MSETVVGEKGMITAPHRAASQAGAAVLAEGGNAIEAMLAAAATIAVVYPHMNGIGGDGFWLIAEAGKPPLVIDACGAAGSLATRERYERAGYDSIPTRGGNAALTVAGTVSGWALALEAAASLGGRMPRRDLLGDAIGRAREGSPVSRSHARMLAEHRAELEAVPNFASGFFVEGKSPEAGALFRQPRLADTLDHLAHTGFDDFYRGDVAAEIAADLEAAGAPIVRADLEKHEARVREPLSLRLSDATLFNTPPPTQGVASLIILALFDRLGVKRGEGFEHHHGLIEATRHANAVRDGVVTDPAYGSDVKPYLQPAWLDAEAAKIDRKRAGASVSVSPVGDTIWMGAIDARGLAVSFIQSLFHEFGSGVWLPRTGILWQNRGVSFSLDPAARNPLMPGRKPFHTLNPALARFRDGRTMVYGSMGGDGQPQFQAQVFTRAMRFGMELGDAVAAPRWRMGRAWGRAQAELVMENRFDPDLVAALERAGHNVLVLGDGYADSMGHAGAIVRRADGRVSGAADPRADGEALAG
ncbi:MAG TPA: gamma-glutamyltransferase family protein [Bauldia sp.]|nr:gamma-glutamyltransferase family protein [Bauldia sp.]